MIDYYCYYYHYTSCHSNIILNAWNDRGFAELPHVGQAGVTTSTKIKEKSDLLSAPTHTYTHTHTHTQSLFIDWDLSQLYRYREGCICPYINYTSEATWQTDSGNTGDLVASRPIRPGQPEEEAPSQPPSRFPLKLTTYWNTFRFNKCSLQSPGWKVRQRTVSRLETLIRKPVDILHSRSKVQWVCMTIIHHCVFNKTTKNRPTLHKTSITN